MGLESNYWVTLSQLTKTSATSKFHYFVLRLNIAHFLLKTTCLEAWDLRKLNIFANRGTLMVVYGAFQSKIGYALLMRTIVASKLTKLWPFKRISSNCVYMYGSSSSSHAFHSKIEYALVNAYNITLWGKMYSLYQGKCVKIMQILVQTSANLWKCMYAPLLFY